MAKEEKTPEVQNGVPVLPEDQRRGELAVDGSARADVVGGGFADADKDAEVNEKNIEDAKADALRNHRATTASNKS